MTGNEPLLWLAAAVVVGVLIRYWWNLHYYPLIACRKCHGSSMRTKWIFHLSSLRFRKIGGHCTLCRGGAWTDRH